jgi:hypothetical protein
MNILLLLVGMMLFVATTMTAAALLQEVYAQQQETESVFFNDPNERTDRIISEVLTQLQNSALNHTDFSMIGMWDDGKIHIFLDNGTQGDPSDDTTIMTTHEYTAENGYQFQEDVIITPNGTELFVGQ